MAKKYEPITEPMGGVARSQEEKRRALDRVPRTARIRIKVYQQDGSRRFKELADVLPTDEIPLKKDGKPFCREYKPGGKKEEGIPTTKEARVLLEHRKRAVKNDPLVAVTQRDPTSPQVLKYVMTALAEEGASIGFEREVAERQGKQTSHISMRRTTVYKTLVDAFLKHMEIRVAKKDSTIDVEGPMFQRIFHLIVRTFGEAMDKSNLDPRESEIVLAKFIKIVSSDDWHARVKLAQQQER